MDKRVDLFYNSYSNFADQVLEAIRRETFIEDIGQNSWLTVEEFDRFISWLGLSPGEHILEVASGSGGPAIYLADQTGCHLTGIDSNESGIATAIRSASVLDPAHRPAFQVADANALLPFDDDAFETLICIDAMNHCRESRIWSRSLAGQPENIREDLVQILSPRKADTTNGDREWAVGDWKRSAMAYLPSSSLSWYWN